MSVFEGPGTASRTDKTLCSPGQRQGSTQNAHLARQTVTQRCREAGRGVLGAAACEGLRLLWSFCLDLVWLYLHLKKTSVYRTERLWRELKELGMINGKYTQGAMVHAEAHACRGRRTYFPNTEACGEAGGWDAFTDSV